MEEFVLGGEVNCLYYVSSKSVNWTPSKTLLVFAPDADAKEKEKLEAFASRSGWLDAAEKDGAVLVLPFAPNGWSQEQTARVKLLHKSVWKEALSTEPREIFKTVWLWETLIFAVGYEEGAVYAANAAVEQPNTFAMVAAVGGVPSSYAGGEEYSDRFLVPEASDHWKFKNKEVPVAVWFLGNEDTAEAEAYFGASATAPDMVKVSKGSFTAEPKTTEMIMDEFATRIRWKNSPDGTPARLKTEQEIRTGGEYIPDSVEHNGFNYNFYTRLPKGVTDVKGYPVVVCMHGHGEPAWMFAQKNGWPELQDETKAFVFVSPDSPWNAWDIYSDAGMHPKMLDKLEEKYGIDRSRIYLTGFSNGSMATCWYGFTYPGLYAAISPWNSPLRSIEKPLVEAGWEIPIFSINGDMDHKMDLPRKWYSRTFDTFILLGKGTIRPGTTTAWGYEPDEIRNGENTYTKEAGYPQGDRLTTYVYYNGEGQPRFCHTDVRDMPHGAIADEARATWEFVKHFARVNGSKTVEYHE